MKHLGLMLPEWQRCLGSETLAAGTLARWHARSDHLAPAQAGMQAVAREIFEWPQAGFPVAALSRQYDVGDAAGAAWLRADPAHVRADMTTARMLACGELGIADDERAELLQELAPLLADSGFLLDAPTPTRWYLRAAVDADLPAGTDPDQVMGDDLKLHLPAGVAGRPWRVLFNEVQMLLHAHPVNRAREARGAATINSLWFWGGGSLPRPVLSRVQILRSDDAVLHGLAQLANLTVAGVDSAFSGEVLDGNFIDLHTQRGERLQTRLAAAEQALRSSAVDQLDLMFLSGERLRLRRSHYWRFWRRVPPLSA
ncbi:MAG: phosphoglycerate mutase [Dokdonella sp.]